jgi:N-methylhydantoinase A
MDSALVPAQAGVLSALGMMVARAGRHLSLTLRRPLDTVSALELERAYEALERSAVEALAVEGHSRDSLRPRRAVDLCYRGQSFALTLPWADSATLAERFRVEHRNRYGHELERPLELVNLRIAVDVDSAPPDFSTAVEDGFVLPADLDSALPLFAQAKLPPGRAVVGPAIVLSSVGTAFIDAGWLGHGDGVGNLRLARVPAHKL